LPKKASLAAAFDVASRVRHPATPAPAATGSPRQEKPQNSATIDDMSQMSQVSQEATLSKWGEAEEERAAAVERNHNAIPQDPMLPLESELIAPASWFQRSAPSGSGEPPFDQPCVSRRGRVERAGGVFLHFCVTCGAWGAFGYGVTGGHPGRWYCREHRQRGEMS
jgi:hypothetical protein